MFWSWKLPTSFEKKDSKSYAEGKYISLARQDEDQGKNENL